MPSTGPKPQPWSYHPTLPITVSPVFQRPARWSRVAEWFVRAWLPISERLVILGLAVISWLYFTPDTATSQHFAIDWMAGIWLRNLVLMLIVAGGLHLYLHTFKKQREDVQYDTRPFAVKRRSYTFNNQVHDNMFWTCASGVTIWSAYECLMLWAWSNGYLPRLDGPVMLIWLAVLLFLIPIWETVYFFLIHRLLHWQPLYKTVHALHHRNTNIGPWSGLSMHPVEHLLYLGSVLIHFVVPAHPLLLIYHLQFFTLSAATTHAGHEALYIGKRRVMNLGTFHHQLHHRYFDCNYGGLEIPWDVWFGSFHDGTVASHEKFVQRQGRIRANSQSGLPG